MNSKIIYIVSGIKDNEAHTIIM